MALEPLRAYRSFSRTVDVAMIGLWALWIIIFSTWTRSSFLSLNFFSLLIIMGAYRWPFWEGLGWLLLVSWIYSSQSLMPSAIIWMSLVITFSVARPILIQISINRMRQFAFLLVAISLATSILQIMFVSQVLESHQLTFYLLLKIVASSLVEGVVGTLFFKLIEPLMQTR